MDPNENIILYKPKTNKSKPNTRRLQICTDDTTPLEIKEGSVEIKKKKNKKKVSNKKKKS